MGFLNQAMWLKYVSSVRPGGANTNDGQNLDPLPNLSNLLYGMEWEVVRIYTLSIVRNYYLISSEERHIWTINAHNFIRFRGPHNLA
jgi:hypothetical protein